MFERKRTALYDVHVSNGARLIPFGGWEMPVEYSGISKEHEAVRTAVGLFDVSHMGEFLVQGSGGTELLQLVTTNDVSALRDGQAQYSAIAYPEGTIVDDLLVYRFNSRKYMVVVNASNLDKDFDWLQTHNQFGAEIQNASDDTTLLALQGPRAVDTLQPLTSYDLSRMHYYRFSETEVSGVEGILSRTGYTGEDGFEFYFSSEHAPMVWETLLDGGKSHGILPAGLGARNTLRLEARMLLYGNDIDNTTTLLEAGLGWITKLEKGDFIGRDALAAQTSSGVTRKLVGFEMLGREIARDRYPVLVDGESVGYVTSGGPSITLKKNIGLAYLPVEHAMNGTRIQVQVRKRLCDARVVPTPFYKRRRSL